MQSDIVDVFDSGGQRPGNTERIREHDDPGAGFGAVRVGQAIRLAKAELTAVRTLEELRRVAFFDIREIFDDRGHLKSIKTLAPPR